MFLCVTPYSLLLYAVWPLFTIQVARTGSFASIFQIAEMWRMVRAQPVKFLLIVALFFGLYMAASFVILPAYVRLHVHEMANYYGELNGLRQFRKHLKQYLDDIPGVEPFLLGLLTAVDLHELERLLGEMETAVAS